MKIFAFIFARGGSKGLRNKNLKKINKKSLIQYSVEIAKEIKEINEIYISTEDNKIKNEAKRLNINIIDRPLKLAKDSSDEWAAWQHAINFLEKKGKTFDVFVSIPATSPLRKAQDVKNCIKALTKDIDIVVTATQSARNPWFNMVMQDKNGFTKLVNKGKKISRRQDAPKVLDLTTVAYVAKKDFITSSKGIFDGNCKAILIPKIRSIDIDDQFDFDIAKYLIEKRKQ